MKERAPEFHKYTQFTPTGPEDEPDTYFLDLVVGHQMIRIDGGHAEGHFEGHDRVVWYRDMLALALKEIVAIETKTMVDLLRETEKLISEIEKDPTTSLGRLVDDINTKVLWRFP